MSTAGGLVRVRSCDIDGLEEWTPGVRAFVEEWERNRREKEKREDWRP
jgi:hypothetical protein